MTVIRCVPLPKMLSSCKGILNIVLGNGVRNKVDLLKTVKASLFPSSLRNETKQLTRLGLC